MSNKTISVKANKEGYRRSGYAFSVTSATEISLEDLTKEQIKAIKDDPNLSINGVDAVPTESNQAAQKEAGDKITKAYADAAEEIKKLKADAAEEIKKLKADAAEEIKKFKADAKQDAKKIIEEAKEKKKKAPSK